MRVRPSPGPWGPRRPYFEGAVLGTQLLLELGDLAGRVLAQLREAGLESLHVLHQLRDLPLFGGQLNFQAGAGEDLYGLLLRRRKEMTKPRRPRTGAWGYRCWQPRREAGSGKDVVGGVDDIASRPASAWTAPARRPPPDLLVCTGSCHLDSSVRQAFTEYPPCSRHTAGDTRTEVPVLTGLLVQWDGAGMRRFKYAYQRVCQVMINATEKLKQGRGSWGF